MTELTDDQRETLLYILELLEQANSGKDAVWFDSDGRKEIAEIRETLKQ